MTILRSCLCWRDLRSACIASATFIMTTSMVQLLLQLAMWCGFGIMMDDTEPENWLAKYPYFALYIGLAGLDFFVMIFAMCVLWGETKLGYRANCFIPLLIVLPVYLLYEAAINIYYLVVMFEGYVVDAKVSVVSGTITTPIGAIAVAVAYWIIKVIILIACYLTILSTYQEARMYDNGDYPSNHSASTRGYVLKTNPYESYGRRLHGDHYYGARRNYGYQEKDEYDRERSRTVDNRRF